MRSLKEITDDWDRINEEAEQYFRKVILPATTDMDNEEDLRKYINELCYSISNDGQARALPGIIAVFLAFCFDRLRNKHNET